MTTGFGPSLGPNPRRAQGAGAVTWFDGNYTQYEADRLQRLGSSADPAAKAKYRQLTRQ